MESNDILVSIRCCTYNHEPYIRQCLEGFVMQRTSFRFEAIVHDDASTDGTAEIIREFAERYPDIIKPIYETENQYSKHDGSLRRIMDSHMRGKYIAMCEGDDYWIDPLKLQKQVNFLEKNPEYSFCCHRFSIYKQDSGVWLNEYADNFYTKGEDLEITLDLFFKTWVTQPLSVVYTNNAFIQIKEQLMNYKFSRDVHLFYHLLKIGRGISLNEKMGVYRWHEGGVASSLEYVDKLRTAVCIYRELYLRSLDPKVRDIYITNGINYLKYSTLSINTITTFKELWPYAKGAYEIAFMIIALIVPPAIVKLISRMKNR